MVTQDTKLAWFDRGAAAFERMFPGVLKTIAGDDRPRYVCPLCDEGFLREAVMSGDLTAEHVPPESFGGRPLVLTCRWCNNTAGSGMDADARKRENVAEASNATSERSLRVRITLQGINLQARIDGSQLKIVNKANNPTDLEKLRDLGVIPAGTTVGVDFYADRFSELGANMSWFRSGFLALFAFAGYRFSFDPATRIVKDQLRSDTRLIYTFTINIPPRGNFGDLSFMEVEDPRCTAVIFRRYVLVYPRAGDIDFYQRLEQDARAQASGAPQRMLRGRPLELSRWEPVFGFFDW